MASLLISAAVNIGVGLLMNALFPPPDIEQEGPRLTELGFTSATYGKFVNIIFGTDRVDGNIIDSTDPPIEEIVSKESQDVGGKGGGQQVTTTSYTYFLTCRIAWGIEGATALIRWWGDGKIIYDNTGSGPIIKDGVSIVFYPGGETQVQDPEEVARRGSNIPAYGHLTSLKVDRMPLADFANRIPNFTAEIGFANTTSTPILNMVEPFGHFFSTGATIDFNPDKNEIYVNKFGTPPTFVADATDLTFTANVPTSIIPTVLGSIGRDGFSYMSTGVSNAGPMRKVDIVTGELIGTLGTAGLDLIDDSDSFGNSGKWYQLQVLDPFYGNKSVVIHFNTAFGTANGSVVDGDQAINPPPGYNPIVHTMSTADGLTSDGGPLEGQCILDHDRGRFFIFQDDDSVGSYNLVKYEPVFTIDPSGAVVLQRVDTSLVKTFTRGSISGGDDFEGTGTPAGWAVQRTTGELLLSNASSIILYNPDTDIILAQSTLTNFRSTHNYYSGDRMAYGLSDTANGTIRVFDPRDLTIVKDTKTDDLPWPSGTDGEIVESACCWDDRLQALFLSRGSGSDAAVDFRLLKIFVNRVGALGVGLDSVVLALSTSYQRQKMAGLLPADINVTTLAGEIVQGYTLNRSSTMKSALQPLRDRFLFDLHQSDWGIKCPLRGASSSVTIPEEDVGILKRGRNLTDEPALREMRQDDLSLPMSLAIRYRNKDTDYQIDVERDKRHLFPNPTMRSKTERTIDIPLVETPTPMKQLAQKTLLTAWNERVSYKTIVPWTYLKLDATDVFSMGVFGETAQLRMAENDLGQGWAIEITGVVEDTKSFSSTLAGGVGLGHRFQTVPSSLPTRLFPFDAPILGLADLTDLPSSNAYMVLSAFEDSWTGASVLRSTDDTIYIPSGTGNDEAALGRVKTAPGAWGFVDGHFQNRFQEVTDGGTMVVTMLRRPEVWASAANEAAVLAGANTIGIIRGADKQVEILNFQNAVINDDNTVTLTRLLRGRLGTEDVADLGIATGDDVILLSNSTNVHEIGPIIRQGLSLADLNTTFFFKGVTFGTLLENAPVISAVYTGRDIKPYSPVQLAFTGFIGSDLDFTWERRTRGPFAGEWLDGQGEVPLNETIEQYEVTLNDGVNTAIKTVNDIKAVTFTEAEQAGALPAALVPPFNAEVRQVSGHGILFRSPAMIIPVNTLTLGPTPSIVNSTVFTAGSGTSYVVTTPAGTLDGHLMVAFMAIDTTSTAGAPAGWNPMWNQLSGFAHGLAFYKIAASEGGTQTFTSTTSQATVIGLFTLMDAAAPSVWASQGLGSNSINHFCTSIVPNTTRSLLMSHAMGGFGGSTYTVPASMNEEFDATSGAATASHVSAVMATESLDSDVATGTRLMISTQSVHYAAGQVAIPAILA